jgi:hypothetical protein
MMLISAGSGYFPSLLPVTESFIPDATVDVYAAAHRFDSTALQAGYTSVRRKII